MNLVTSAFAVSFAFSAVFAETCIPWVGGAKEYVANDCVTLGGASYYAVRPVNAWTPPTDTWHWTTVPPVNTNPTPVSAGVVLDPLAIGVNRSVGSQTCPTTKTFPLSEQSYTVSKNGLIVVDASLLIAQISAGEGRYNVEISKNGAVVSNRQFPFMVEAYYHGGHYREANGRNHVEVNSGDQLVVKTSLYNTWVNVGENVSCHAVTIENADVRFYEGGRLLSTTTPLQRQ